MRVSPDLTRRRREPELMDDLELEPERLEQALQGLSRLNRLAGSARLLWQPLRLLASGRTLRVLDLATGSGDLPIAWSLRAQRAGLALEFAACDLNARSLDLARARARSTGAEVRFFHLDVLEDPLPEGFDVVTCSLFLHHLDEGQALELLRRARAAAETAVLIQDLIRSGRGHALARLSARWLQRSDIVRVDAVRSVRGAYTLEEARELTRKAGLAGARIERRWPERFVLSWSREP